MQHMIPITDVNIVDNYNYNYQQQQQVQVQVPPQHPQYSYMSNNTPPLSQYDAPNNNKNNMNNNKKNKNNLKFVQSALPTITHNQPKLHNPLPDDAAETEVDDDATLEPLYDHLSPHPLVLDGTTEQEIKKLHHFPSEPPLKQSPQVQQLYKKQLQPQPPPQQQPQPTQQAVLSLYASGRTTGMVMAPHAILRLVCCIYQFETDLYYAYSHTQNRIHRI